MRRVPSLKMQCCLCTLTLFLQSLILAATSLMLCCSFFGALLLQFPLPPPWHSATFALSPDPLLNILTHVRAIGPRGERGEFAKQRRAHKKETVHWTDSAPNLCTWLSHFSAVQQMTMYSISYNLEWVPLCKIGWKQSHKHFPRWLMQLVLFRFAQEIEIHFVPFQQWEQFPVLDLGALMSWIKSYLL